MSSEQKNVNEQKPISSIYVTILLTAGMLITGSINTISKKLQNQTYVTGFHSDHEKFSKPWTQTLAMFIGEAFCLLYFFYEQRKARLAADQASHPLSQPLIESTSSASTSTSLSYSSISSTTSNSTILHSISVPPLAHNAITPVAINSSASLSHSPTPPLSASTPSSFTPLPTPQSGGLSSYLLFLLPATCDLLGTTFGGIGLLYTYSSVWQMLRGSVIIFSAILSILFLGRKFNTARWVGMGIVTVGLALVGTAGLLGSHDDSYSAGEQIFGILMVILGQFIASCQMVVEETFLKKRNFAPAQVVGAEGTWGLVAMVFVVLPICFLIPGGDNGSYEDGIEAVWMTGHSKNVGVNMLIYICSIAFYNFFSLSVQKKLSTIHRTLIDALRTIIVWAVNLFIYYEITEAYGESWSSWSYLQVAGFALLFFGTLVYNELVKLPCISYDVPKTAVAEIKQTPAIAKSNPSDTYNNNNNNNNNNVKYAPLSTSEPANDSVTVTVQPTGNQQQQ
eukprot:TRINITY_DN1190_c0_g3_i1.p1 TRINITY_DN1190_c0_g3~~TRINITY_DN1190_c0_g3_i1.p1  ORF type:complete len:508 (-),score=121.14 TRINITY_DN1190_c0_g3_i1:260-1783(-)